PAPAPQQPADPGAPAGPGGPGGPTAPGGGITGDHVRPQISKLALSRKTVTRHRRARVTYRVSEAATITVKVKGRTVLTARLAAGKRSFKLTGKVGRKVLRAGRYRVVVTARDAAGNVSLPVSRPFRVR